MTTMPRYVESYGHGEQSYQGPLAINDVVSYGFPMAVDRGRLQHFVDTQLNGVTDEFHYTALPFVIHAWVSVGKAFSFTQNIGWMSDQESQFFVPLLQKKRGHLMPRLVFWIPYLFIDVVAGLVTAREVYGFRKMPAAISIPRDIGAAAHFWADTLMFRHFDPDKKGEHGRIIETTGPTVLQKLETVWEHPEAAARAVIRLIASRLGFDALMLTESILSLFFGEYQFPMINLKQFRDARDQTRACYQALVSSPGVLQQWTGGGLLAGDFETEITSCANYQIVSDLGLAPTAGSDSTTIRPLFGFWITMSFTLGTGKVLWQA